MKTNVFNRLHFVALSAILLLASGNAIAQSNAKSATVHGENNPVFINVDPVPVFPGGEAALMKFINENLRYPAAAIENGIQGRVVVQFVVKKDGSVGDVKVIRGIDPTLDQEAIRVCKTLPKFIPGKRYDNGEPVDVWFTIPVIFKLDNATNNLQTDESEDMANDTIHNREIMLRPMEQMPEFPGGQAALMKFINENLRYPATAIENGIQGRVMVQFVVKKDGSVDDVTVLHGVDSALDQEAIRVCKTLPKFIPGKRRDNGEPINAWVTLPITFKLDEAPSNLQTDESEDMANDTIHNREIMLRPTEQMPEFPGGQAALMKFINENLRYPATAIENGIQGRVVVQFVVKKDGSVNDNIMIVRGVDPALDQEAIRVCKTLPKFIPGKQNGQPVNVWFTLPIIFNLSE